MQAIIRKEETRTFVSVSAPMARQAARQGGKHIWIDLDNSPHVPFFMPIIGELERRGYSVTVTARDCFQVCGLADLLRLKYRRVGRHYGKSTLLKLLGLGIRGLQLMPTALRRRPALAISHGSRSQLLTASLLRIPSIMIGDYEFSKLFAVIQPDWLIVPQIIPAGSIHSFKGQVLHYPGIKEDVYAPRFTPEFGLKEKLGLNGELIVTIRPPATEAHYHVPESDELFDEVMNYLSDVPNLKMIVLPRSKRQEHAISATRAKLLSSGKMMIPSEVVDGMNLIWHSDLVISGGGTMNREAAALGVPVYSIFRGKIGAVDQYLAAAGRLTLLESRSQVRSKLLLKRRNRAVTPLQLGNNTLHSIVDHIVNVAEEMCQLPQ